MTIYFYGSKEPYWEFSNFSRYGITLDNEWWRTSEHYFQAQKFVKTDAVWAAKIRGIEKPRDAASMGRDRNHSIAPDWETTKDDVMRRAVHGLHDKALFCKAIALVLAHEREHVFVILLPVA